MSSQNRNSARIIAALIFMTPILVLISSSAMFYSGYTPEGTVNKGTLLDEPIQLKGLSLSVKSGPLDQEFPGKWSVVQFVSGDCKENCWETLYTSRQIHTRLAKDSSRVVRYLITIGDSNLSQSSVERIANDYPELHLGGIEKNLVPDTINARIDDSPYILFDPLGNGILIYDATLPSGELLKDIKKVLQNSKIG